MDIDLSEVPIRRARQGDLDDVFRIIRECFIPAAASYLSDVVTQGFCNGLPLYVAEYHGLIVGFSFFEPQGDNAELHLIAVSNDYQWRGIGRKMMEFFIATVRRQRCKSASLLCCASEDSQHLYRSIGFVDVERIPRVYANGDDALRMELVLE